MADEEIRHYDEVGHPYYGEAGPPDVSRFSGDEELDMRHEDSQIGIIVLTHQIRTAIRDYEKILE